METLYISKKAQAAERLPEKKKHRAYGKGAEFGRTKQTPLLPAEKAAAAIFV